MFFDNDPIDQLYAPRTVPPLPPEETQSRLEQVGSGLLGGLGYLGDILDKTFGSRAVRGILGGHAREALSVLPMSDTLGLTDYKDRVSGKHLLQNAGLIDKTPSEGFGLNDLLGMGAEIALDPSMYFGAGIPKLVMGGLNKGARIAGKGLEAVTGRNPYSFGQKVIGEGKRIGSSLFDQPAGGTWGAQQQDIARTRYSPELATGRTQAMSDYLQAMTPVDEIVKRAVERNPDLASDIYNVAQRGSTQAGEGNADRALLTLGRHFTPEEAQEIIGRSKLYAGAKRLSTLGGEREAGVLSKEAAQLPQFMIDAQKLAAERKEPIPFQDIVGELYAPRTQRQFEDVTGNPTMMAKGNQALKEADRQRRIREGMSGITPFQIGRNPTLQGWGGTDIVNDIITGAHFPANATEQRIRDKLWETLTRQPAFASGTNPWAMRSWGADAFKAAKKQVEDMMRLRESYSPEIRQHGLFSEDLFGNFAAREMESVRAKASANAVIEGFNPARKLVRRIDEMQNEARPFTTAPEFLKSVGMTHEVNGSSRGIERAAQALGVPVEDIGRHGIPVDEAKDFLRMGQTYKIPSGLQPIASWWDDVTRNMKSNLTYPFPGFFFRNLFSGAFQQWRGKALNPTAIGEMKQLVQGGKLSPETAEKLFPGMSVEDASRELRNELMANRLSFTRSGQYGEPVGGEMSALRGGFAPGKLPGVGGEAKPSGEMALDFLHRNIPTRQSINPFNSETFFATKAGTEAGNTAEDMLRGSHYLSKRLEGFGGEEAAQEALKYQLDYSKLTEFERNIMRRAIPFYSFCVPEVEHEILTSNGWKFLDDVKVGDKALACNHDTGEMAWQPIEALNVFEYDGELMVFKTKRHGELCCFTPGHRWPVIIPSTGEFTNRQGRKYQYDEKREFRQASDLASGNGIPWSGKGISSRESLLSPRLAAILGWVVTDGYHRWRGNHCEMMVYQSPKKFLAEIMDMLGTCPRKPHPQTGVVCVPVATEDVKELTKLFKSKEDMSAIVVGLSRESAEAMWTAMFKAEGSTSSHGQAAFSQDPVKGKHVLDAFQILCLMTGRNMSITGRGGYLLRSRCFKIMRGGEQKNLVTKPYSGRVWCPTTEFGTWIVRHNGYAMITGNSRRNLPPILEDLATKPAKLAATMHATTSRPDNEFVPPYLGEGTAIKLGEGPGGARYLSSLGLNTEDEFLKAIGSALHGEGSRALQTLGGGLSPLPKSVLEQIFNTQMHTGRKLTDLRPNVAGQLAEGVAEQLGEPAPGIAQKVSQLAAATPFSRAVTSAGKLVDPRKELGAKLFNFLSGAQITDVDVPKQEQIAVRDEVLRDLHRMPNARHFEVPYVPADKIKDLTPRELEIYRFFKGLEKKAEQDAKKRKQQVAY